MIYTIIVDDGLFGIDRDFRKVNLEKLSQDIETVQFDTKRKTGIILYRRPRTPLVITEFTAFKYLLSLWEKVNLADENRRTA